MEHSIPFEKRTNSADHAIENGKKTILVVDDSPNMAAIIKRILQARGYQVLSVYSGESLFELLEDTRPDLILLDVVMPGMSGLEVLKKIRLSPDIAKVPVILLSARGLFDEVLAGYRMGGDYYITKPFTSTQLLNGINLVLGDDEAEVRLQSSR